MPELWELCNHKSMAELIELYCIEHGCYPDFYYILLGEFMSPEEEHLAEVNKELPPKHPRRVE